MSCLNCLYTALPAIVCFLCILSHATVADPSEPFFRRQVLFQNGDRDYALYRIPSLVVTNRGTTLAFSEGRKHTGSDWDDIDISLRRSVDGGRSWSPLRFIADQGELTLGNPCPVVDRVTNTIWLPLSCGNAPGQGNRKILLMKSTDDGQTWTEPIDISQMAKKPNWPFIGTGPGHGIQLKSGRLLIPCWNDTASQFGQIQTSFCFYSDDHGTNWKVGVPLSRNASDECDVVELVDGRIYLNARSRQGKKQRAYAFSENGGHSWSEIKYDAGQPEPSCDGALVRLSDTNHSQKNRVLISCPANPNARDQLTIRMSYDECQTWPVAKLLDAKYSGYSDMAVTNDGTVLCLYETEECSQITLASFNLEWLTDGKDSRRNK